MHLLNPQLTLLWVGTAYGGELVVWAGTAYGGELVVWADEHLQPTLKIVFRPWGQAGPWCYLRRWIVERTLWLPALTPSG
ncbi:hypothetical protein [Nonomuraea sp. NPDC049750]|uniref:hypothetical protein n=1 Tax=Nonomuraea sp. NPDC049750 TaxID=3154738 RepID=UPI0033DA9F58